MLETWCSWHLQLKPFWCEPYCPALPRTAWYPCHTSQVKAKNKFRGLSVMFLNSVEVKFPHRSYFICVEPDVLWRTGIPACPKPFFSVIFMCYSYEDFSKEISEQRGYISWVGQRSHSVDNPGVSEPWRYTNLPDK